MNNKFKKISLVLLTLTLSACNQTIPEVELPKTLPEKKVTNYSTILPDLGLMTEVYDSGLMRIMSNNIGDNTGAARSTGSEIPRDITEITKSVLNSIGGNVIYIPYDPAFVQNNIGTGYSNFENKIIPDVVISGGITEFDRGLETRGSGENLGVDATTGGEGIGVDYGNQRKSGLARITLDFNMLNFQTMAGIPRMNVVNSMKVHKGQGEKEFSVSLFGVSFGSKGEIKKVQGRHEAVRLLVELSMIQMVGKYAAIPYWRLLGEGAQPDSEVTRTVESFYYALTPSQRLENIQEYLYILGYDLPLSNQWDAATHNSLKKFDSTHKTSTNDVSLRTFQKLYLGLPVTYESLARRKAIPAEKQRFANLSKVQATATATATVPASSPAPKQDNKLSIRIIQNSKQYKVGDQVTLTLTTSSNAYTRCYYQDSEANVVQVLPNPYQEDNYVRRGTAFILPNQHSRNYFAIELSTHGVNEYFACFASRNKFGKSLPDWILRDGLEALPVKNLNDVIDAFSRTGSSTASDLLKISVN